jgi:UDP-glucose:(heptosyl)LPS alpha-1,3-glucosyltransferase
LSNFVAEDLRRLHGVADDRIRIVPNGVDTERFSPVHRAKYRLEMRQTLGIDKGTITALFVAQSFRLKGIDVLLRCMALLNAAQSPVHLVVVGGKKLSYWRRRAVRLGLQETVSFVGPQPDPVPYYAAADLLVHPTYYDPCSLVLLEAAASGLPLVTTQDFNGVAEMITDGVEGFLLSDPDASGELASRIHSLADGRLRTTMGDAARRFALRCPFDRKVDQLLDVYHEIRWHRRRVA